MNIKTIAFDIRILKTHPNRGSTLHLLNVIQGAIKDEVILFSNEWIDLKKFNLIGYKLIIFGPKNYLIWEQIYLPYYIKKYSVKYLYSPNHTSPLLVSCKKIIAVYDLIFSEYLSIKNIFSKDYIGMLYRYITTSFSIKFGAVICSCSGFTIGLIKKRFQINENVYLIYPTLQIYNEDNILNNKFRLLMVTGLMHHKNMLSGIHAFYGSKLSKKLKLTIIGVNPKDIEGHSFPQDIDWRYNIDKSELKKIYSESSVLLFPSTLEGFGIPLIEAMEFNLKIVCSNNSVFPEICENAAIYFDPYKLEDIVEGINDTEFIEINPKLNARILEKFSENNVNLQVKNLFNSLA